jgi:hypothetical protein
MPFRSEVDKVDDGRSGKPPARQNYRSMPAPVQPNKPSTAMDALRNFGVGLVQGTRDTALMGLQAAGGQIIGEAARHPQAAAEMLAQLIDRTKIGSTPGNMVRLMGQAAVHQAPPAQTATGRYARAIGSFVPNAVGGGGSVAARAAGVVVPALASETLGHAFQGTKYEGAARFVGALGGGVASGVRVGARVAPRSINTPPPAVAPAAAKALNFVAKRVDIPGTQSASEKLRGLGIEPTLVDVVGDSGRGVIRAAASRQTPARQAVTNFYKGRREGLPDLISRQSQVISPVARSADDVVADLTQKRSEDARVNYAEPYAQTINITPEVRSALIGPEGRAAIQRARRAASASRDVDALAHLKTLEEAISGPLPGQVKLNPYYANATNVPPLPPVTGAVLDRVQIALGRQAKNLLSGPTPSPDIAGGLLGRQRQLNDALDSFEHLGDARSAYRATSREMEAAETGSRFLTPGTADEFAAAVGEMTPEALAYARTTAARAVQTAAGERVGSAPGVADRLAHAPEQQARNAALLGPKGAADLQARMAAAGQTLSNAAEVAPRTGSNTALNVSDMGEAAGNAFHTAAKLGSWGGRVSLAVDWLKTRASLDNNQAQALAEMAIDPAQTDTALAYLQSRLGPTRTQEFVQHMKQAAVQQAPLLGSTAIVAAGATQ